MNSVDRQISAARAPSTPAKAIAAMGWMPAGSGQEMATIMAPAVPMKNEPSAIMENWPQPKMMMTARAVNISGEATSTMLPIRRRDVKGPMKKL